MARFAEAFRNAYYGEVGVTKSMIEASAAAVGAPQHEDLEFGETREATIACAFIDLRGFTKMALALPDEQTVRILQAVLVASNVHFAGFGGSVLDFADGAMVAFERGSHSEAVWDAVRSVAFILADIRTVVNEDLKIAEDHTVRAAAGMEFGRVLWTRLGDESSSQVKPISGVSFLAGKNSQSGHTSSWEALMGPDIAAFVPDNYKTQSEAYSFQFENDQYSFSRWLLNWSAYLADLTRDEAALRRSFAVEKPRIGGTAASLGTGASSARRLRDEPYA